MTVTNRETWNKLATTQTSVIVGGKVEVTLMNGGSFSIYSEIASIAEKAKSHYEKAGATMLSFTHYEEDEDMPEAFNYIMLLPN